MSSAAVAAGLAGWRGALGLLPAAAALEMAWAAAYSLRTDGAAKDTPRCLSTAFCRANLTISSRPDLKAHHRHAETALMKCCLHEETDGSMLCIRCMADQPNFHLHFDANVVMFARVVMRVISGAWRGPGSAHCRG